MHNKYWLEKWENADIGFNQSLINPWLQRYFPLLNKMKGSHFFVPLSGKSIDMAWIKQQGMKLTGVELSPLACLVNRLMKKFIFLNGITEEPYCLAQDHFCQKLVSHDLKILGALA